MISLFEDIYKGKKVLVTGHTGFKGSWFSLLLLELGAEVIGYSLDPISDIDNFVLTGLSDKMVDIRGDIRDREKLNRVFEEHKPDMVFHFAAQPLVRYSYEAPVETFEVNVMGTINVLEAIKASAETTVGVFITTDKCYENREQLWGYREDDALGGYDPYSASKGACEIAIASWQRSFFNSENFKQHGKSIASVRAGNVIGGGDWALDRIIPDCIRAVESSTPIEIRSPQSVRPWEHVLEPLFGYLQLGYKMVKEPTRYSEAWNFGPSADSIVSVWDIATMIIDSYGEGELKDISDKDALHEAKLLALDISKARYRLGWKPTLDIRETVELTVDWYKKYDSNDTYQLCVDQIKYFTELFKARQ